jgi:hypothetical protein
MCKAILSIFSSTFYCAAILSILVLGCGGNNLPENPYHWEIENNEYIYLDSYYEDGYYYVISEEWDTKQSKLTKIRELDGKIIYSIPFKKMVDHDLRRSSSTFREGDRLMFVEGKYIHQFKMSTGQLISSDKFTNFIWSFHWTKEHITACSYKSDYLTIKYYEIVYNNGHYAEKLIHEEIKDSSIKRTINGGTPPIYANGKWMMTYEITDLTNLETKNFLLIKNDENVERISVGYDNNQGKGFAGPILSDDENMYVYCVDKLFAFDIESQAIKWSTNIIGSGLNKVVGDYIYTVSALSVEKMSITDKYTGTTNNIDSRSAWSGQSVGDYLCWTQGEFYKFNTKTKKFEFNYMDEDPKQGYWEYSIGVSPYSKLLFDRNRWVCMPF